MLRDISTFVSVIVNLFLVYYCVKKFRKNPLSFDVIMYFLYLVFYYIPMLDYIYKWGLFSNEALKINGYYGNINIAIKFNIVSLVITACFILGFKIRFTVGEQKNIVYNSSVESTDYSIRFRNLNFVKLFLFIILFIVVFSAYRNYQFGIKNFFSMARKDAYSNSLQTELVVIIPTALLALEFIREIKYYGKLKLKLLVYVFLLLVITITRGQRRELINDVIFIALLLMYAKTYKFYSFGNVLANKKLRKYIIALGVLVVVLVPITWYLRVYSTQLQYGNKVNPFQYRGWFELLFGSSSSGFQTSIILDEYSKEFGLPFLSSVKLMISYFIPRSLLDSKAMILTRYVQQGLNTSGNLSVFYINDVWFNFYSFSPIISLGIGSFIGYILRDLNTEGNLFNKIIQFVAFSKIITLFKNGYTGYFFGLIIFFVIWKCIERIVSYKTLGTGRQL